MCCYRASFRAIVISGLLLSSACMNGENVSDTPSPKADRNAAPATVTITLTDPKTRPPGKNVAVADTTPESIEALLEVRSTEYDTVIQEARNRGAIGGAVRGGLIGLLIAGNPEGAFAGALLGSAVGTAVAEHAASELVAEHRNYLIRRWSLEKVIEAARNDTQNTRFDLLLSQQALENTRKTGASERTITLLSNFQKNAKIRALALREVVPLYRDNQTANYILIGELEAQINMIEQIEANVDTIGGH